jgi:putative lipoic acid-binding regulatory protein
VIKDKYKNVKLNVSLQLKNFNMNSSKKTDEFYDKLKTQLYDTSLWPAEYLYKFIVLSDGTGIKAVENIFNNLGAVMTTKESKNGKYTSISVNVRMKNPEAVIGKYKEVAEKVEEVISL